MLSISEKSNAVLYYAKDELWIQQTGGIKKLAL